MAKHNRMQVLTNMIETGLIPVFYNKNIETAEKIIKACLDGGIRSIEFTNRGDQAHIVFGELIRRFEDDERCILGVGSVLDPGTASLYIQLGANFVVGPVLNPEVAKICNRRKIAYSPGCGSLTEISTAEELGVEICKIFPGKQVGGPEFVKAIRGPMPWTRLMPTGGVSPTKENLKEWFDAGVACVGMGSKLVTKEAVSAGDFSSITQKARQSLGWIKETRIGNPVL
ncbi:MAG: bifunctional 4-hydroxy-2-oxoglutarate aldolase/2-dehydro-3-deoxy-phosphogluconate aldolase [Chloroflexi bacterium]|jgi:2-dehydro-3-deoxyphosphogluconate aldolase / (4S)-4-hydroxy-2-oxoglutarate aldolase|nr:bifunctional 4-hydroxy-2-oxoglutarate aldolase/2-dehydro-3-deoxy-phosphogluconate aldolase [Chloroflexota bacterium]MBT4754780.1 bifunctional 4-hydroxy-2-oxoglutarate aldolase/2-dehydro-3-deoxy-phosphogluconate aldolase [Chloroflexota bacterium]MBT6358786.1 bifunctional 4-hydroxy-2-oxoglutarate aldolase/2-dehydro-3-deoxy-phosphogluconate aldolase [Chloroflexota bacterium]MBT6989921.1 bifunctional 4-hydroxy-2-oxoglutarate aldolase/2-dehydro-3-deoxy-phosphogluconate aldolase [Chloroflexota bact